MLCVTWRKEFDSWCESQDRKKSWEGREGFVKGEVEKGLCKRKDWTECWAGNGEKTKWRSI